MALGQCKILLCAKISKSVSASEAKTLSYFWSRKFTGDAYSYCLTSAVKDSDGTGTLDLQEFGLVMELLRVREGFAKSEFGVEKC